MESETPSNRFARHPKKVLVVYCILITLLLDMPLTMAYHLWKYGTIHKSDIQKVANEPSSTFHHALKPNQRLLMKWGTKPYTLSTNSLGFKDSGKHHIPLTSLNYRLMFLGDSFTEGLGYGYEQTFVGQIDAILSTENIEVLNASASSYAPSIYLKKMEFLLETVGLTVNHVIVFLDISDIQDEQIRYDIRDGNVVWIGPEKSAIKDFIFEYTGMMKNVWKLMSRVQDILNRDHQILRSREDIKYGINDYKSLWTISEEAYEDYGEKGLQQALSRMDQLYILLTRHDIEMTLAVYPWPDQIINQDSDSLQVRIWSNWAQKHTVTFFNFFPAFMQSDKNPRDTIRKYFIEGDVHWNGRGHRLMADQFIKKWKRAYPFSQKSSYHSSSEDSPNPQP